LSSDKLNKILREQLDQAHLANQQLTDDLRRNTTELQQLRGDLTQKTRDWQEEERVSLKDAFLLLIENSLCRFLINIIIKNII
jgi:hypothetical protein